MRSPNWEWSPQIGNGVSKIGMPSLNWAEGPQTGQRVPGHVGARSAGAKGPPCPFPGPDPASAACSDSGLAMITSCPQWCDPCLAPCPKPPVDTRSGSKGAQPRLSMAGLAPGVQI